MANHRQSRYVQRSQGKPQLVNKDWWFCYLAMRKLQTSLAAFYADNGSIFYFGPIEFKATHQSVNSESEIFAGFQICLWNMPVITVRLNATPLVTTESR